MNETPVCNAVFFIEDNEFLEVINDDKVYEDDNINLIFDYGCKIGDETSIDLFGLFMYLTL